MTPAEPEMCPDGCGCRLGTEDADARECGCDGPCCGGDDYADEPGDDDECADPGDYDGGFGPGSYFDHAMSKDD